MKINNGDTNKISVYITGEVKEPLLLITDPGQSLCQLYDRYELENIMTENSFIEEFQWSKDPIEKDTTFEVINKNNFCFGKRDFIIGKDEKVKDEFIYDKEKPECDTEKKICGCRSVKLENENPVLKEAIDEVKLQQHEDCVELLKDFHKEENPNYIDDGYIPELLKKYKSEEIAKEKEFRENCINLKPEPGERGKIIVLEGIDCSFKETQSKMLLDLLTNIGIKTTLISFPTYDDESSVFVRRFLNGEYGDEVSPELISTFYALNRYDTFNRENIMDRLEQGEWFIFDRYTYSNVIHQCARYEEHNERENLEEYIYDITKKSNRLIEE